MTHGTPWQFFCWLIGWRLRIILAALASILFAWFSAYVSVLQ